MSADTAAGSAPGVAHDIAAGRSTGIAHDPTAASATGVDQRLDLRHLLRLSDEIGLLEHAQGATPRREHGYCVDDAARAAVVLCRESDPTDETVRFAAHMVVFLARAQGPDGSFHNRLGYDGYWHDEPGVGDWWGRALWGLGTAGVHAPEPWVRELALARFNQGALLRTGHVRAMAFAGLGAAQVLAADPDHQVAHGLLLAAVAAVGADGRRDAWPWPQDRLHYANAVLPEVLIGAGCLFHDQAVLARGLRLLGWLMAKESAAAGHLSPTPVGGRSPDDARPGFDQQPIEIAALADACATALAATGELRWAAGIRLAAHWFDGGNDVGALMSDAATGGGYDGLTPAGPNLNQGAESTLALLSVRQQHRRLRKETP